MKNNSKLLNEICKDVISEMVENGFYKKNLLNYICYKQLRFKFDIIMNLIKSQVRLFVKGNYHFINKKKKTWDLTQAFFRKKQFN